MQLSPIVQSHVVRGPSWTTNQPASPSSAFAFFIFLNYTHTHTYIVVAAVIVVVIFICGRPRCHLQAAAAAAWPFWHQFLIGSIFVWFFFLFPFRLLPDKWQRRDPRAPSIKFNSPFVFWWFHFTIWQSERNTTSEKVRMESRPRSATRNLLHSRRRIIHRKLLSVIYLAEVRYTIGFKV